MDIKSKADYQEDHTPELSSTDTDHAKTKKQPSWIQPATSKLKMPCGKFKDFEIRELPDWYLKWVAQSWDGDEQIRKAAEGENTYRYANGVYIASDID